MEPKYTSEDAMQDSRWKVLRDWEYTLAGIYSSTFEKVEKKKVLLQRSLETQIKTSIDVL